MVSDLITENMIASAINKVTTTESCWGKKHPKLLKALQNLSDLYFVLGRYDDAKPIYRRILEMQYKLYGPKHRYVADTLLSLGELHEAKNKIGAAEGFYTAALWILDQNEDHLQSDTEARILLKLYGIYKINNELQGISFVESRLYGYFKHFTGTPAPVANMENRVGIIGAVA